MYKVTGLLNSVEIKKRNGALNQKTVELMETLVNQVESPEKYGIWYRL